MTNTTPSTPGRNSMDPPLNNPDLDGEDPNGLSEWVLHTEADQDQEPGGCPSQTADNGGGR